MSSIDLKPRMRSWVKTIAGHIMWPLYLCKQLAIAKYYHLKVASLALLSDNKRSDTLFILGSGSSIMEYDDTQWAEIAESDSIGINNWILHDFVPRFYAGELLLDSRWLSTYARNLAIRYSDYAGSTLIIMKWRPKMIYKLTYLPLKRTDYFVAPTVTIPAGGNPRCLHFSLRCLDRIGVLRQVPIFFTRTGSVDWCVLFGYKLGYRNIVLCGVDLNNTRYFWEINAEHYEEKNFVLPEKRQRGPIHKTLDSTRCSGGIPIDQVLLAIKDALLEPRGISLYVGSKTSALYPRIPAYPWGRRKGEAQGKML